MNSFVKLFKKEMDIISWQNYSELYGRHRQYVVKRVTADRIDVREKLTRSAI